MQFLFTNIYGLLRTLRPRQWVKNGFVFMALLFDQKLTDWNLLLRTVFAFVLFCMISSVVYIINDLVDLEKDKQRFTVSDKGVVVIPKGYVFES